MRAPAVGDRLSPGGFLLVCSSGGVTDAEGAPKGCEVHMSRRSPCRRVTWPKVRADATSSEYQSLRT
ncbi:hypothetical protein IG631_20445 [Alternaria alternata]|nr:hypothetical protein IG631_20445 [Alternaria alternata]